MRRCLASGSLAASAAFAAMRGTQTAAAKPPRGSHYARLGVAADANAADIKAAYRKKALQCHPDMVSADQRSFAEADFRRVAEAYSVLGDAKQRAEYDKGLGLRNPSPGRAPAAQAPSERTAPRPAPRAQRPAPPRRSPSPRPRRPAMKRGDAEAVFRDAFHGKTVQDILFAARFQNKYGPKRRAGSPGRGSSPDRTQQVPLAKAGKQIREETVEEAVAAAAEAIGEEFEARLRFSNPKATKVYMHARRPVADIPGTHVPFRPFANMDIPEGVTTNAAPQAPKPLAPPEDADAVELVTDTRTWRDKVLPKGFGVAHAHEDALQRAREKTMWPDNQGQLWSWQRPA